MRTKTVEMKKNRIVHTCRLGLVNTIWLGSRQPSHILDAGRFSFSKTLNRGGILLHV